jgi:hypothetical protein
MVALDEAVAMFAALEERHSEQRWKLFHDIGDDYADGYRVEEGFGFVVDDLPALFRSGLLIGAEVPGGGCIVSWKSLAAAYELLEANGVTAAWDE